MFSPHSALTRSLALLLPICFMWVFAACVSSCAAETGEADHGTTALRSAETANLDAAHDDESCPLAFAPDSLLPEASRLLTPLIAEHPRGSFALLASRLGDTHLPLRATTPSAPDPPLLRLCTLRI